MIQWAVNETCTHETFEPNFPVYQRGWWAGVRGGFSMAAEIFNQLGDTMYATNAFAATCGSDAKLSGVNPASIRARLIGHDVIAQTPFGELI